MREDDKIAFEAAANEEHRTILGEFWSMLKHNKKYWLLPIILILCLLGLLIILGASSAAPFVYTLF